MTRLSAIVCVRNEEQRLSACLENLGFADQVVVVLDRCTDRSGSIAEQGGAAVVAGIYPLEGDRRAAGMAAATGDWILEVDADETIGAELAREIRATIASTAFDWMKVPVHNYIGERLVRYGWGGSFGTSLAARLYRHGSKRWGRERVHPNVWFEGREGPNLRGALRHQFGEGVSDVLLRLDRYTALRAQDLREHGGRLGKWDNVRRGVQRFWKCYVRRGGWREGGWGLLLSLMAALYPLISVLRAELEGAVPAQTGQMPTARAA